MTNEVRGEDATADAMPETISAAIPQPVRELLTTLWHGGHAAYVVGGALRDIAGERPAAEGVRVDWDLATSALPEQTVGLFENAVYENRFGTVAVRRDWETYEITTFRSDHDYADFRRPHRVEFGLSLEADLARRDFTMNAVAWGANAAVEGEPHAPAPGIVDPFGGLADIAAGRIRAVGEPRKRFEEDALRIIRAIRFAATLGWTIEPETLAAIHVTAPLVAHLSGERIAMELEKLLAADRPSVGLRLLADTGVLDAISPDLAAQRGVAQNKITGEDLWDHTLRTVDASANQTIVRLAALVHDIGKPATAADGHFYRHEAVGADLADALLDRLRVPTTTRTRVVHLVRQHMFRYEPSWGDSAIRRFLAKIGPDAIDQLFALREADNAGSGVPRDADDLAGFRARIATELAAGPILDRSALAVDGSDLMAELGVPAGPEVGRILSELFDQIVENPRLNDHDQLMEIARANTPGSQPSSEPAAAEPMTAAASAGELSVQLYAVRASLAQDVDATLERLAALGFRRVEPFDLVAFRERLGKGFRRLGLAAPTAHVGLFGADLEAVFDAAVELGIATLIQPWTDPARWQSDAGVHAVAAELNAVAARAASRGLQVGYHNHHFELASMIGGRHALEAFADLLDPSVALEVDTYWAHVGGADVPALLRRLDGRVVALHVKDGDGSLDNHKQVAVGAGTLPIREIVGAAPAALRVIELDDTAGDMFDALRDSRAFLLALDGSPA
ncbi:MAG TPA: TIM barrel protein [Candidatus Limnocylindrales bacterium]|nr:TIM barrel protein [Candidatus Limnocylindrales bacterium]